MDIDMHYYGIYVLMRAAELGADEYVHRTKAF